MELRMNFYRNFQYSFHPGPDMNNDQSLVGQWHKYIKSNQLFINADMIMDMEYGLCECIQEVIQNGQRLQQIQSTQLTGCGGSVISNVIVRT